jgi:cell division protein FtsL
MVSLNLANAIGWVTAHWKVLVWCLSALLLICTVSIVFNRCGKREVKINEWDLNMINSQSEKARKEQLKQVIEENQGVIKTTDDRTELAEVNRVEREKEIDAKIAEVDKKIIEAKSQGRDVTESELKCLLIPENCK